MAEGRFSFPYSTEAGADLLRVASSCTASASSAGALPVPPLFAQAAAALASTGLQRWQDPGRARTVRRQRRTQHAGSLRRRRLLQAPAEYRHPPESVRKIDDHFGFSRGMAGFERLYKDGKLAIVHGCGYENPSFSHFTSMAYWHTAAPNSGEEYGWVGRLADAMAPRAPPNFLVNIDARQSLAVRSRCIRPWSSTIRISSRSEASTRSERSSNRWPMQAPSIIRRADFCWIPPAAPGAPRRWSGSLGEIPFAGGLRNRRSGSAQSGRADRRRHAHALLLHRLSQQRVRHARVPERRAPAPAHLRVRCRFRVHDGSGADRPRR